MIGRDCLSPSFESSFIYFYETLVTKVKSSIRHIIIQSITDHVIYIFYSIKDIFHERAWLKSDIFAVQVSDM